MQALEVSLNKSFAYFPVAYQRLATLNKRSKIIHSIRGKSIKKARQTVEENRLLKTHARTDLRVVKCHKRLNVMLS